MRRASVLAALGLAAATACGGISERHVDDGEAGSGGDGNGGTGADGGSFNGGSTFTGGNGAAGGSDDGGSTFTGGTGAVGGSFTGGTGAVGGSFTGGVGGSDGGSFTGGSGAVGGTGAMGGAFTTGGAGGVGTGGTVPVAGSPSGGAPSNPYAIPWQFNGYIAPETNMFAVEGGFYFSTDCASATAVMLPCTEPDPNLLGGDGQYGWAVSESVACVRGVAPQVTTDPTTGMPAYDRQWGALLGIALYQPGDSVFDAKSRGLAGFQIDIVGVAPADVRVNVVTPETVGASHFVTLSLASPKQTILFSQLLQGNWVNGPVPFDPTRISGIEFHVYTNTTGPKPFDFCITNLRGIPG